MSTSGMLRRVVLVRTGILGEYIASSIRAKNISELGTTLTLTNILHTYRREDIKSYKLYLNYGARIYSFSVSIVLFQHPPTKMT
jgi:hypothetical protein